MKIMMPWRQRPSTPGGDKAPPLSHPFTPSPLLLHIHRSPSALNGRLITPPPPPEQGAHLAPPQRPPQHPPPPGLTATTLIRRIYCALVHTFQPVTHAPWVDPGRIQFVRYYILIPLRCTPLCSLSHPLTHPLTHTHASIVLASASRHHRISQRRVTNLVRLTTSPAPPEKRNQQFATAPSNAPEAFLLTSL